MLSCRKGSYWIIIAWHFLQTVTWNLLLDKHCLSSCQKASLIYKTARKASEKFLWTIVISKETEIRLRHIQMRNDFLVKPVMSSVSRGSFYSFLQYGIYLERYTRSFLLKGTFSTLFFPLLFWIYTLNGKGWPGDSIHISIFQAPSYTSRFCWLYNWYVRF